MPLERAGCYAETGPLGMLWAALSKATPGQTFKRGNGNVAALTWGEFLAKVAAIPAGALWRHNQAGDLPGRGDAIDTQALAALVKANAGRRGFTYTHKPVVGQNAAAIKAANAGGFTVNLSADNLSEADQLAETKAGPVVVVLSADVHGKADIATPKGRKVAVCPATYRDDVNCSSCGLCQRQERKVIIGFPAHGAAKRKASAIATNTQ